MEEKFPVGEHIVDRLLESEPSATADPQLEDWQQASPENKKNFEKYQKIWDATADVSTLQKFDSEKAWNQVDLVIERRKNRTRQIKNFALVISGMAASLLIFLSLTFYTNLFSNPESAITMSTTYGSRSEVLLPDGSKVKLNAGSNLEYHFDKVSQTRKVDFSGEAFFEVAKSKKPFVIETAEGLKVKVLGTKFNLSSYPDDRMAQTSLVEGKVELSQNGSASLILNPGQIATLDKNTNEINYTKGEISHTISWMQNKLYMDNMSLQEVCIRLERWYDIQITLSNPDLGEKIHYTGVLKEQTVLDVLDALCRLSMINYEIKGKSIIISGK
jgi:ferric-dicitrate binding protein FerR (iron transport regulator)